MAVKPIPEGYHTITPYLVVTEVADLVDFLKQAFDASEIRRTTLPGGKILNVEMTIGDSVLLIAGARSGHEIMLGSIYLYVEDTDVVYKRALEAGAISMMEPEDQFYGDRNAGVKDTLGNHWWIATRVENVSNEEAQKRVAARVEQQS